MFFLACRLGLTFPLSSMSLHDVQPAFASVSLQAGCDRHSCVILLRIFTALKWLQSFVVLPLLFTFIILHLMLSSLGPHYLLKNWNLIYGRSPLEFYPNPSAPSLRLTSLHYIGVPTPRRRMGWVFTYALACCTCRLQGGLYYVISGFPILLIPGSFL
ncbi:hypothetical protein BDR03DRAFT_971924 [Suillus americanus]|nr:hypothetical protein BDR03DRAFT_971924 [Suillus americanus]